jgi:prepilin-type N-terminal cleavage/methylation domain-containing protein
MPNPLKLKTGQNQYGFTLIELLVVVVVMTTLSGIVISLINSGGFRDKAKDSQRIANVRQIQTALELYFADFRAYPTSNDPDGGWEEISGISNTLITELSPKYINVVPVDSEPMGSNSGPCNNIDNKRYNYRSNDGTYYILTSIMAVSSSNDGTECSGLNNWGSLGCSVGHDTEDYCYGVENP